MDILLDTTIQIERIFKRSKRAAIEDMMSQTVVPQHMYWVNLKVIWLKTLLLYITSCKLKTILPE